MKSEADIRHQLSLIQEQIDWYQDMKDGKHDVNVIFTGEEISEYAEIRRVCYQNAKNALLWVLGEGGV